MRYKGLATFVAFGRRFAVDARIDWDWATGQWSGVLSAPLDWEHLLPNDRIAVEIPAEIPTDPPYRCPLVIDLVVGDKVAAHGWAPGADRRIPVELSATA